MELELKRGGRTARVETLGGELVSYRAERGLEYIWGGDPAPPPPRSGLLAGAQSPAVSHCGDAEGGKDPL